MLTRLSRAEITTPPINGARIVSKVLEDEQLTAQWLADLGHMSGRMKSMRERLVEGLRERRTPGLGTIYLLMYISPSLGGARSIWLY